MQTITAALQDNDGNMIDGTNVSAVFELVHPSGCTSRGYRPTVYDAFPFFNELDMLEIRLHELQDVADYHILVESPITHSNQSKPLYFEQNKQRFAPFIRENGWFRRFFTGTY